MDLRLYHSNTPNLSAHMSCRPAKGTGSDWLMPQVERSYEAGKMPALLPDW
jgi:hypothetical protein